MVRHPASQTVERFLCGCAGWALAAVFFLFLIPGSAHVATAVAARERPLTVEEIMQRLGEYDQKIPDCAGLVAGLTGYAYAIQDKTTGALTVVLACK